MAKCVVRYLNGKSETYTNCGTSVYNGNLYIWNPGTRRGRSPRKVIPLSSLHSLKKTGQKGIIISKY